MTIHSDLWELLESGTLQPTGLIHVEEGDIEPEHGDAAAFAGYPTEGPAVLVPLITPLSLLDVDTDQIRSMSEAYGLYPYQAEGLHFLLARSTVLLADDMGLGKTRQALVAALAVLEAPSDISNMDSPRRALIVCPASLKRNWEAELKAIGIPDCVIVRVESLAAARAIDQSPSLAAGVTEPLENHSETASGTVRFVIVNYELLRALDGHYTVAIFDEAHYLKEPGARRTQEAFRLAQRIPRRWLLTATPMLNRDEELWTLLRLGGHPMGALSLSAFRSLYAGEAEQRALLGTRIQEWMLRRQKHEVLTLPGKYHQTLSVNPEPDWVAAYAEIRDNEQLRAIEKIGRMRILMSWSQSVCTGTLRLIPGARQDRLLVGKGIDPVRQINHLPQLCHPVRTVSEACIAHEPAQIRMNRHGR
ncbi:SNF2-related protein [Acidithiobacillus sp.]|uniref:SNF2-related protein n=1 Tax=Acidithiobacillus sp. TaxID=1872118 RepID=UPI003D01208D